MNDLGHTSAPLNVGICGTFDVANYGDLLFPLIAEAELTKRLGPLNLHRFSYHSKTPAEWPYAVTSVASLPRMIHRLDALLIGGGFLIRFDQQIAPGYLPPNSETHHPTGYWLTPALIALQHDVPVIWNAPGMNDNTIPAWAAPLLEMALKHSRYVSVRDERSRAVLEPLVGVPVTVVPDTAFGLPRLLNLESPPSAEFARLATASGLDGPYIVIQATRGLERFVRFVKHHEERFRNLRFLVLPVGPVLGDRSDLIDDDLPGVVRLTDWPSPLVIAELIGRSEAVVGHSYHLFITALATGVPIFTEQNISIGKYSALQSFDTIFALPNTESDVEHFLARVGRGSRTASARATDEPIREHWDRIASTLQAGRTPTSPALNQFWQSLPGLLQSAATPVELPENRKRLDDLEKQLVAARAESASLQVHIKELNASISWKLTAPMRFIGRHLLKIARPIRLKRIINLDQIRNHRLETDPYRWAAIENLYSPADATKLAATFPCDHFKLVSSYGGEKDYEYEARALIGMGADVASYSEELSDSWRALARDLLSPGYRSAMSTLTGYDLAHAPMEVNVFHYGPGASLGAHPDLPDKLVTHVLYFNRSWNPADGGCLSILRSPNPADMAAEIVPVVGNSAVIVRSDNSWHAVSRVVSDSASSRRSVTVTFYRPGSISTMWPPNEQASLHRYRAPDLT